jgi:hypothetical protein
LAGRDKFGNESETGAAGISVKVLIWLATAHPRHAWAFLVAMVFCGVAALMALVLLMAQTA